LRSELRRLALDRAHTIRERAERVRGRPGGFSDVLNRSNPLILGFRLRSARFGTERTKTTAEDVLRRAEVFFLQPLAGVLLARAALGEPLGVAAVSGGALILLGVLLLVGFDVPV
jgi:hypothetical protein